MSDLIERLRVKSAMITLGEKIAFGSETALMDEAALEIENLRAALTMPDAERRLLFISDLLAKKGHFNRADICQAFSISVPQASIDIRRWIEKHQGATVYNSSAKRYEIAALKERSND